MPSSNPWVGLNQAGSHLSPFGSALRLLEALDVSLKAGPWDTRGLRFQPWNKASAEAWRSPRLSISRKEKRKNGRKPHMDGLLPGPLTTLHSPTQGASQRKNVLTPLPGAPLRSCLACCLHPLQLSPDPPRSSELCLRWKKCHSLRMHSSTNERTKCRQ